MSLVEILVLVVVPVVIILGFVTSVLVGVHLDNKTLKEAMAGPRPVSNEELMKAKATRKR